MKCKWCGGSLLRDDEGDYCINCSRRPIDTKKTAAQSQVKPEEQADIVTPQIADRLDRFRKRWTPSEREYLANYYGLISNKSLARRLHRTEDSIIKRAWYEHYMQGGPYHIRLS